MDCIFCKIAAGEIPCAKVYEDEDLLAFRDIHPQAPVHVLVIPKCHLSGMDAVTEENSGIVAKIFAAIPTIAKSEGLTNGYRVISNCGPDACQSVPHLHFHLLGGAQMAARMG